MTASAPAPVGPVTLVDVRAALGETDPGQTNASALRTLLGRGSFSTIQKHLDAIRSELSPAPAVDGAPPVPPADALAAVWAAAWSAAQVQTLRRLEAVTAERDTARIQLAVLTAERDAANASLDSVVSDLAAAAVAAEAAQHAAAMAGAAAAADASNVAAELASTRVEVQHLRGELEHAQALAQRDAELKDAAHARAVDRLLDQIAEFKSALRSPVTTGKSKT